MKPEGRHLIGIADIDTARWDSLYSLCREIIAHPHYYSDACRDRLMASLFFEPSTRTKFSFQAAMQRLGGKVFGFENADATSASKGESLADTVRMAATYSDVIVIRNPVEGAAKAASLYSDVPVINAGDGGHMHPTQTLTDLTTIAEIRGKIGDFTIGLCGDLKNGRTVHSLVAALAKFGGVRFVFISPPELSMPEYITRRLKSQGAPFYECLSLEETLPELDTLYMTRIQRERMGGLGEYPEELILTKDRLAAAKRELIILHPLPRVNEIAPEVDADPRARYFDQARYGMYIRMALLTQTSHMPREKPEPQPVGGAVCDNRNCVTRREPYLPPLFGDDGACGYCDS
ncbi:MAG: aspartate carbamoyltransferase [Oscillospiraceae bacterium]|jgi:aspartate carbamoyltransferase catalytic subunit|nr:aspartate carbamoyltransferase [Oscillospiraceae bacterium]